MKKQDNHIKGLRFGEERALYHTVGGVVSECRFEGEEDGESALKESRGVRVEACFFDLRYPFWHNTDVTVTGCHLSEKCRAPMWYDRGMRIEDTRLHGPKALRECSDITISGSDIVSPEFGWRCKRVSVSDSSLTGEYAFFEGRALSVENLDFKGKYSFQYVQGAVIKNSILQTKDAFWHAKNITVEDSVISGEYLGWYSENLTLIRCKIAGTQPLCYCKGLTLIDCTTEGCDLAFEYSDVTATVKGGIDSVKNPRRGRIEADGIGEIIRDGAVKDCRAEIFVGGKKK